jgi:undecaprenyl-diphosphatase
MDMIVLFQAALLGVVEGVTEFLPISSTGHLIVVMDMLGFKGPEGKIFEVIIQLGAILAVCWYYRVTLWTVARGCIGSKDSQGFVLRLLVAFMPSVVIGLLAHDFIKQVLFSPLVVAVMLVVGGIIILWVERLPLQFTTTSMDTLTFRQALYIGLFQVIAMIPGTSRSGATIIGAMLVGTDRKTAAEFSFFLAMPTMFAATLLDVFKARHDLTMDGMSLIAVGFVTAFISGFFAVAWLLKFISSHNFVPFAWYRIILGLGMLFFLWGV